MDSKKLMLSHIERMNNFSKTLAMVEVNSKHNGLDANISDYSLNNRSVSKHSKKNSQNSGFKSSRKQSKDLFDKSTNLNSTCPSPLPAISNFRELALQTIHELMKIRAHKLKKNLEMMAEELKVIEKLKNLILTEIKNHIITPTEPLLKLIDKKIYAIIKESAEELSFLENKCKELIEKNHELKAHLSQMHEKQKEYKKFIKNKGLNDYLEQYALNCAPEAYEYPDVYRNKSYLQQIDYLASKTITGLSYDKLEISYMNVSEKLAALILQEKLMIEKNAQENKKMIEYENRLRIELEAKIKRIED
ncbi:hypothetical protein SteCoe_29923 [Stentor coeruleus]|uniref:Uncharacterized protein n=1 Tax=Stentor coeruleus TaxID=5963 RepID=A0A1R2B4R5_9CILI|nr:hypothetical protein SteCoe_29923 [Stentor coeruleus]